MAPNDVADNSGDVVVTDQQLYDQAVAPPSPEPAATPAREDGRLRPDAMPAEAPAPQQEPAPTPAPLPQPQLQPGPQRDDQGRFAPKQPPQPQQPQQRQPEDHRVPLRDLLEERERRQKIEAEANEMRNAWAQFQRAQQAAAQQQQAPQTIFDNPDEYLQNRVMAPLRQEGQMYMLKVKDDISRYQANQQHGEQVVNAALNDLTRIRNSPQGDYVFNQIMQTGHPYDALVRWHSQARAQQQIGPDPEAWFRKRSEQLLEDPRWQAEAAKRYYARQQQQNAGRPPQVNLPPSLSTMPASSGRAGDQGDLSDASLYSFATK